MYYLSLLFLNITDCFYSVSASTVFNFCVFPQERLAQSMFDHIPVGVGSKGIIPMTARDLEEALEMGMDWSLREGKFSQENFVHMYCIA